MSKNLQPLSNRMEAARGSSLAHIKTQQLAREEEGKLRMKRLKGTIVLMEQFMLDQGYTQSLQALQRESNVSLTESCPADNIDLLSVITEFEQYYEFKFLRKPKLFRARNGDDEPVKVVTEKGEKMLVRRSKGATTGASNNSVGSTLSAPPGADNNNSYGAHHHHGSASSESGAGRMAQLRPAGLARAMHQNKAGSTGRVGCGTDGGDDGGDVLGLSGHRMQISAAPADCNGDGGSDTTDHHGDASTPDYYSGRALKPLPAFPTSELSDLAGTIMRDILDVNPSVRWDDIAELDGVKQLLKEAVVMPVKYPEMFQGILRPWKGILLFGPPGTGKTLLARAVATECRTTFFNISASTVVSKWRGDSEKLVRMLFDLAVHYAPSTIFIDEIDSIMSARSSEGEHEGSRRMKTELLTQMDGLSKRKGGDVVFVLAASNVPWDLDTAMLRRLEKRLLVTLPTRGARVQMFRRLLAKHVSGGGTSSATAGGEEGSMDWEACADLTEGMSGADIDVVCREAMMRPIRTMIAQLEGCGSDPREVAQLQAKRALVVTLDDVQASVAVTQSSVHHTQLNKYAEWAHKYGSGVSL